MRPPDLQLPRGRFSIGAPALAVPGVLGDVNVSVGVIGLMVAIIALVVALLLLIAIAVAAEHEFNVHSRHHT
jgi:hypothetical protein